MREAGIDDLLPILRAAIRVNDEMREAAPVPKPTADAAEGMF